MAKTSLITTFGSFGLAFRNSSGLPVGTNATPDTVVNGTAYPAFYSDYGIDIASPAIERPTATGLGGGRVWQKVIVRANEPGDVAFNTSADETTLKGYIVGTAPDTTTNTSGEIVARNASRSIPPQFIFYAHEQTTDADTGANAWRTRFFLNCQINLNNESGSSQGTGENPNPLPHTMTINYSDRNFFGQKFSANSNLTVATDRDVEVSWYGSYKMLIDTYVDDGTATADAFTLAYVPASTTIGDFFVYNVTSAGVATDDSSNVSVAADGDVSLTAANTAGDTLVIVYPVPDNPVATA